MRLTEADLTGGGTVYCINEGQLRRSHELASADPTSSPRIQGLLEQIRGQLSRNEQAALAFLLVDRLLRERPAPAQSIAADP
jgi:hypothetical protein